jgi:hypothetical protein
MSAAAHAYKGPLYGYTVVHNTRGVAPSSLPWCARSPDFVAGPDGFAIAGGQLWAETLDALAAAITTTQPQQVSA